MLTLAPDEVHLWLCFYDKLSDRELAPMGRLLTDDERRQQTRFYFAGDRQRYLATRALVRTSLSEYLPQVAPAAWQFTANDYGRPAVCAGHHPQAAGLGFNISHTRGLIVLALARQRELGVDVEHVTAREVSLDIASHFFSAPEVSALAALPESERQDRFFEYWTFKESYIKARGMGLSLPLDQFSFHFPTPHAVRLALDPRMNDEASRWDFHQFRPAAEYQLALCVERGRDAATRISMRRAVPAAGYSPFDTPLQRRTAP